MRHDWEHRKQHTFDLLQKIRLGLVPVDRLKMLLGDEILAIPECKSLIEEVTKLHATVGSTQVPLNQSHPDMFASRNTITVSRQLPITHRKNNNNNMGLIIWTHSDRTVMVSLMTTAARQNGD